MKIIVTQILTVFSRCLVGSTGCTTVVKVKYSKSLESNLTYSLEKIYKFNVIVLL